MQKLETLYGGVLADATNAAAFEKICVKRMGSCALWTTDLDVNNETVTLTSGGPFVVPATVIFRRLFRLRRGGECDRAD